VEFTIGLVGQQLEMKMFATLYFSNFSPVGPAFVGFVGFVIPFQEVWLCVFHITERIEAVLVAFRKETPHAPRYIVKLPAS
jgi:hypothetical protein